MVVPQTATLRTALTLASRYWDTKGGSTGDVMRMRVEKCVERSGWGWDREVSSLGPQDGTHLLTALRKLALGSRSCYYAAFTRMLTLSGVSTVTWPKAGQPSRRVREPMPRSDAEDLHGWFTRSDMPETADLLRFMLGTGARVDVEALSFDAWWLSGSNLRITGKGGHERVVPVAQPVVDIVQDHSRSYPMRRLSYGAHLKRWHRGVEALGITSKLPTPHAIRHLYATEAYKRSGGNLHVVRELLGHADINTTARYIGVDIQELRHAAGC